MKEANTKQILTKKMYLENSKPNLSLIFSWFFFFIFTISVFKIFEKTLSRQHLNLEKDLSYKI